LAFDDSDSGIIALMEKAGPPHASSKPVYLLRALRNRNYRLFFSGQGISLIGTWMQSIALNWLVYRLTDSALLLGLVAFAGQIPMLLLAPLAGVFADRWNLRRLLVLTQTLALLQAAVLAYLTLTHRIQVWHMLCLSGCLGLINAFDMPTRQAFVVHMVERSEDLGNAIALNSFLVNGARLIGPSLAGLIIAAVGEGVCFLLNALSYLAVIVSLLLMVVPLRKAGPQASSLVRGLHEGFAYAFGFPPIRTVLLLLALSSLMGMSYTTIMPLFAAEILSGGPRTLGFLLGATGLGAVVAALYLASRPTVLGLGRNIYRGAGLFGLSLVAVGACKTMWLAIVLMFLLGMGMMLQIASSNTILQTIVDDDKRGRVMSIYAMAFLGMTPFGSLMAGSLAHGLGSPLTLMIGGVACFVGAVLFALRLPSLRPLIRPIYIRKGIIQETADDGPLTPTPPGRG
jgi:MFS family permease